MPVGYSVACVHLNRFEVRIDASEACQHFLSQSVRHTPCGVAVCVLVVHWLHQAVVGKFVHAGAAKVESLLDALTIETGRTVLPTHFHLWGSDNSAWSQQQKSG
jgi:hypothetical protein